jgi:hypothetical protein
MKASIEGSYDRNSNIKSADNKMDSCTLMKGKDVNLRSNSIIIPHLDKGGLYCLSIAGEKRLFDKIRGLQRCCMSVKNRLSLTDPIDLIFACANIGLKPLADLKRERAPRAIWVGAGSVFGNQDIRIGQG